MNFVTTFAVVAALLGSALMGGVFFAFSNFVMKALGRLPVPDGIAAMQSINVVVINPVFLGTFVGTAVISALVAVLAVAGWGASSAPYMLLGSLFYLGGTFLVTGLGNVPLNHRLAAVSQTDPAAQALWHYYLDRWTMLNTLRTISALLAALMFIVGLLQSGNTL
ncbi:DUF1772 domain-containing protein [Saccharospirillum alexandrii]|uniref:anthrone oxygenase family protein n=1 Tax=Saccharospirillum alexandrii TaxID=2448477 RepID=UPI000FDB0236|nr:anthrone oxygenase family protein [Saccharospirillum alexandrii]